jgi:hypothetical protein
MRERWPRGRNLLQVEPRIQRRKWLCRAEDHPGRLLRTVVELKPEALEEREAVVRIQWGTGTWHGVGGGVGGGFVWSAPHQLSNLFGSTL